MKPALEIEDLAVSYNGVPAVNGVSFTLHASQHLTLLGPSGCGKSTILRSIAGLEKANRGRIRLFGEPIVDVERGVNVPPERRELSMVFQNYAIWPHMSVFDNVAYGLRVRNTPSNETKQRVAEALALVGLSDFADRPATNLSGGQQQRVALARSFVFRPRLILFDEPLSNLDAKLRIQMREDIKTLQRKLGIASVFVTHDQEEALVMSDSVVVLQGGLIEQVGSAHDVYFRPATRFVADFVGGSNILPVVNVEKTANGHRVQLTAAQSLEVAGHPMPENCSSVAIKTVHLQLSKVPIANNIGAVKMLSRSFAGDYLDYVIRWGDVTLKGRHSSREIPDIDGDMYCAIDPQSIVPLSDAPVPGVVT